MRAKYFYVVLVLLVAFIVFLFCQKTPGNLTNSEEAFAKKLVKMIIDNDVDEVIALRIPVEKNFNFTMYIPRPMPEQIPNIKYKIDNKLIRNLKSNLYEVQKGLFKLGFSKTNYRIINTYTTEAWTSNLLMRKENEPAKNTQLAPYYRYFVFTLSSMSKTFNILVYVYSEENKFYIYEPILLETFNETERAQLDRFGKSGNDDDAKMFSSLFQNRTISVEYLKETLLRAGHIEYKFKGNSLYIFSEKSSVELTIEDGYVKQAIYKGTPPRRFLGTPRS